MPKTINKINPKMDALFPNFFEANFPILKPIHVKRQLTLENISIASILLSVTAERPKPAEKASMDTPKAKRNIPKIDKSSFIVSSFFIISISKLRAMKRIIHPRKKLLFNEKNNTILSPMISPK